MLRGSMRLQNNIHHLVSVTIFPHKKDSGCVSSIQNCLGIVTAENIAHYCLLYTTIPPGGSRHQETKKKYQIWFWKSIISDHSKVCIELMIVEFISSAFGISKVAEFKLGLDGSYFT